MEKKELENNLNETLAPIGFKKKGNFWVKNDLSITKIVNLQKSQFSNSFYINYGYIINTLPLGNNMMHIFNGLSSIDNKENERIKELLNLENKISSEQRTKELKQIILKTLILNFQLIQTEDDLLNELKKRSNLNDIPLIVKKHFGLPVVADVSSVTNN